MVGMRPEVMPLDTHLNQDFHKCVNRHVNLTNHLPDNHPHKFGKRTPKKISNTYIRVWDPNLGPDVGAPPDRQIKQDVDRVVYQTYRKILFWRGRVLDTAAYLGRRGKFHDERVAVPCDGRRTKGDEPERMYWVHLGINQYEEALTENTRPLFDLSQQE